MNICYLIQGSARLLKNFPFPRSNDIFIASYDEPLSIDGAKTIYVPNTSWAEGRNTLLDTALKKNKYDYFVFCDDDVSFLSGSFFSFEQALRVYKPLVGVPRTPASEMFVPTISDTSVQRANIFDQQFIALHKKLIGKVGIAPLVTEYDNVSWHITCEIFNYLLTHEFHKFIHQYNDIMISNNEHRVGSEESDYRITDKITTQKCIKAYLEDKGIHYRVGLIKSFILHKNPKNWYKSFYNNIFKKRKLISLAKDWKSYF